MTTISTTLTKEQIKDALIGKTIRHYINWWEGKKRYTDTTIGYIDFFDADMRSIGLHRNENCEGGVEVFYTALIEDLLAGKFVRGTQLIG